MAAPLEVERETFERNLPQFLESHTGDFVLIRGDSVYGFYATRNDGLAKGYELFGVDSPFLVKQIVKQEKPEVFQRLNLPYYLPDVRHTGGVLS